MRYFGFLCLCAFSLVATACGGKQIVKKTVAPEKATTDPLPKPGHFFSQGIAQYAAKNGLPPNHIEKRIRSRLKGTLTASPALNCLAREYAARFGADGRDPSPSTVYALAGHCGYWTKPSKEYSVTAPTIERLETHLANLPNEQTQGIKGVGAVRHADGRITLTILTPASDLSFEPVNRHGPLKVIGRLRRGDGSVEFWLQTGPETAPKKLPVKIGPTGDFNLITGAKDGSRLEIARRQGQFRNTIALIELSSVQRRTYPIFADSEENTDARRDLIARVNVFRKTRSLPPLELESHLFSPLNHWLNQIAQSKTSDLPPGILDQRGWPYVVLQYGITTGKSSQEAFELLRATPTGYRLLTNPDVDRTAVGLLPYRSKTGFDAVLLGLKRFDPLPIQEARGIVIKRMNESRIRKGALPLKINGDLSTVAQDAADAVRSNQIKWNQAVRQVLETIAQKRLARGRFGAGGDTTVKLKALSFDDDATVLTPSVTQVGIGIASGPVRGTPRFIVIYVVAEKNAPPKEGS